MENKLLLQSDIKVSRGMKMKDKIKDTFRITLHKVVDFTLKDVANSRCWMIYYQPKQPDKIKKYRKF